MREIIRCPLPDVDDHEREQSRFLRSEPQRQVLETYHLKYRIGDTESRLVNQHPDKPYRDRSRNHRDQEQCLYKGLADKIPVQKKCYRRSQDNLKRQCGRREHTCSDKGLQKPAIQEHCGVIPEKNYLRLSGHGPFGKT